MKIKQFFTSMFAKENVNSGRQLEFDIAKTLSLIWLPFIHMTIECCSDKSLESGVPYLFDTVIGGPLSAPIFLFMMGVGMVFVKNKSTKTYFRHAISIGVSAFVFNFIRFVVPYTVGYFIAIGKGYGPQSCYDYYIEPMFGRFMTSDVLQFACIAIIVIALMIKFGIPKWGMFLIGLGASLVGTLIVCFGNSADGVDFHNYFVNIILGYFIGTEDNSRTIFTDFVLLHWLLVPICGYIFGSFWIRLKNKARFLAVVSPTSIIICAIYYYWAVNTGFGMFGEGQNCYYHMNTLDTLICIAALPGIIGICYLIAKILPNTLKIGCMFASKSITTYYCIHWFFVVVIANIILFIWGIPHGVDIRSNGFDFISVPEILIISTCITISSLIIASAWRRLNIRILWRNS